MATTYTPARTCPPPPPSSLPPQDYHACDGTCLQCSSGGKSFGLRPQTMYGRVTTTSPGPKYNVGCSSVGGETVLQCGVMMPNHTAREWVPRSWTDALSSRQGTCMPPSHLHTQHTDPLTTCSPASPALARSGCACGRPRQADTQVDRHDGDDHPPGNSRRPQCGELRSCCNREGAVKEGGGGASASLLGVALGQRSSEGVLRGGGMHRGLRALDACAGQGKHSGAQHGSTVFAWRLSRGL